MMHRMLGSTATKRAFGVLSARLSPYPYQLTRIPKPAAVPVVADTASPLTALAFGKQEQADVGSDKSRVIGWLRSEAGEESAITPQAFIENMEFSQRVEHVVAKHAHEDPELQALAAFQKSGWMNIVDGRNPAPLGRTGNAEDIFGCVLVENKAIKEGSFQANWAHRPVTRDGLFQLPKYLHAKLLDSLYGR